METAFYSVLHLLEDNIKIWDLTTLVVFTKYCIYSIVDVVG